MNTVPILPACDLPATVRLEVYSPSGGHLHGSLDGATYACEEHALTHTAAIDGVGLVAYRCHGEMPLDRQCGDTYWYPTAGGAQ
jgi:hypothetical protein